MPSVGLTADYLKAAREFWLTNLIEDQITYHRSTKEAYRKLDRNLYVACGGLFAATLVACGLHLLVRQRIE